MARPGYSLATEESWQKKAAPAATMRDFLSVSVGDEEYGVDIQRIREIIKVRAATEVPRAPNFVLGVISVRGRVLPVIDLRLRLRLAPSPSPPRAPRILVVSKEDEQLGLQVDEVRHVVRLSDEEIEPPPPMLGGAEADFVAGIGRPQDRLVILLHLDQILRFEVHRTRVAEERGAR
jgi:purine-binding chemotaxis protein CheW